MNGEYVDFSTFATQEWVYGPQQVTRYNAMAAMGIDGSAAPGFTSGDAIAAMEALAEQLPPGFRLEWTGMSLEEKEAGAGADLFPSVAQLSCSERCRGRFRGPAGHRRRRR